jgi:CheY-like chemotaxis protein
MGMGRSRRPLDGTVVSRPWQVLIAGDNSDSVELLSRLLAAAGHQLERASSKHEVLATLASHSPHVLLIDVTRPGHGDALMLIEAVRNNALEPIRRTKVVVCAARGVSALFARDIGADQVLVRPFAATELVTAIADLMSPAAARVAD